MLNKIAEVLEHLDLTPRSPVVIGGRSIYGGILFLLYIPLLVLYLYTSIVPLYGPLPSCCACTSYDTPEDSFIYMGLDPNCTHNDTCRHYVKNELTANCDAAVNYSAPLMNNIRVDIALIICAGMVSGAPCTQKCLEVSQKWLGAQDYTYDLNRYQAKERCPSQVGICDFKAVFEAASTDKFPQSVCRYPDLTGILTRLGAGLGLVNGLLVTVRMLIRAVWIRVAEKKEDDGKIRDYTLGVIYGTLFNYFSVTFFLVSSATSKRMRYGAQLAVGLIFVFLKTPLVVSLVYLLGQFWAPMMVYSVASGIAYLILYRTLYCILRLETRCRERGSKSEEFSLVKDISYSPRVPAQMYPHSYWRNFFIGFLGNFVMLVYMLRLSWQKRNSGYFAGAMCGASLFTLGVVWTIMYALHLWKTILFDFPFPVSYPKSTVIFQSLYFTFTTICSLIFVYYLCSFLKALPNQHDIAMTGTKNQYRTAFTLSSLPVVVVFVVFFFAFFMPYTTIPLPDSIQACNFPLYQVVIPFVGVIPGFVVFIFAKIARVRWGAFAACGFSFLVLSVVLNIFIFQYCLGSTPHRRPFYLLVWAAETLGSFIVIYGAIRPNQSRNTGTFDLETDSEAFLQ